MMTKLVSIVALVACVSVGLAQGGGQRRGGAQGMGQRGGSIVQLLTREDVKTDIALTDDQKTKLEPVMAKLMPQRGNRPGQGGAGAAGGNRRQGGAGAAGGQNMDAEARAKAMAERQAEMKKALGEVLTPAQITRLEEIAIQLQGNRAIMNAEVQKKLELKEDQVAKTRELQTKLQTAMQNVMAKVQDGSIERDEMRSTMEQFNKTMDVELGKILTAQQTAKLKELGGKPFKAADAN